MKKKKIFLLSSSVILLLVLITTWIISFYKSKSIDSTIVNNDLSEIIFESKNLPTSVYEQEEVETKEIIIKKSELEKNFKELFETLIVKIQNKQSYFNLLEKIKDVNEEAIENGLDLKPLAFEISSSKNLDLLQNKIIEVIINKDYYPSK
ncbi:MAG: hypothetical protein AD073_000250 [Mycoplasmataceae bacterium]|nr:MAG: hypothetical protein AD073_000250 [Mycoplasmataceae bacterium]